MTNEQTWINPEVDRSGWGPGPWDGEPDKVQWTDEATGYPCIASRGNPRFGNWCGYVAVPPGHRFHGASYDDVDVEVHGGLTFSASCAEDAPQEIAICHVPEPGEPADVWWLGWDAGHAFDIAPGLDASTREHDPRSLLLPENRPASWPVSTYKTLEYVKRECAELARQLAGVDGG